MNEFEAELKGATNALAKYKKAIDKLKQLKEASIQEKDEITKIKNKYERKFKN